MTSKLTASNQLGDYPRPQLLRGDWTDLSGTWDFALGGSDDQPSSVTFDHTIVVPYPPESEASGLAFTHPLHTVWYRRHFGPRELEQAGLDETKSRILLHFGAVDWEATVWVNGIHVAEHRGGQSPFTADITHAVEATKPNEIVVRAIDDPRDVSILRGKQDWQDQPHAVWYHRTTGIWQPVWLEAVPAVAISGITWNTDIPSAGVEAEVELAGDIPADSWIHIRLTHQAEVLAESKTRVLDRVSTVRLHLPRQANGQAHEELLWSPDKPNLIDATITLQTEGVADSVESYLGLRSVTTGSGAFLLNDRPITVRAVLSQNYWPESHLAAPSWQALHDEVRLIRELGFNAARVHQKAEDPRFLYWADKLGLMVWAETASAYAFSQRAVSNYIPEWMALVSRDRSHPSVVTWVPLNESWGVQHIGQEPRQRALSRSVSELTRSLDGTRPVVSNDGWEHTCSDIITIHDYVSDPGVLEARYATATAVQAVLQGFGPAGRRTLLDGEAGDRPVMLTEFGGVSLATGKPADWGYSTVGGVEDFTDRVCALIHAAADSSVLAGFCYTQLTDTGQETNGLLYADRTPKVPVERIRAAIGIDTL